jgi:hypothetical protein
LKESTNLMSIPSPIKAIILKLPFGLGPNLIIPAFKFGLSVFVCPKPIINYGRKRFAKEEALKIRRACKDSLIEEVVVCFDLGVSALGLGEVFYNAMLARYASLHNKKTNFVFINSKIRDDFNKIFDDTSELESHIVALYQVAEKILYKSHEYVHIMSRQEFSEFISKGDTKKKGAVSIFFEDRVKSGRATYNEVFNTLNWLLYWENTKFTNNFLLTYEELSSITKTRRPDIEYVTFNCRYSKKWAIEDRKSVV